ncbi:hypothetical protein GALMADRAFT_70386 [Galerina marginata CBS 339.88]|uniref:DUF8212 domain-containing protein n=1 Tax=Galerina marginata (strain CBS 339.88) TaxID=685588 RepID=A0A067SY57_GALM3|nr:hypothetical protein GALMADRAFT_70386 [Galerina marginata CBS 339.88]
MSFQNIIKLHRITAGAISSFIKTHSKVQFTSSQTIDKLLELSDDRASTAPDAPLLSHLIELLPHIPHSTGLVKLINFCALAQNSYQCNLAWIDTCCIDKTSSAELDEAIRSMFRWYQNSGICIIHLADTIVWPSDEKHDPWFTRGWTLQELLAPPTLKFYTSEWKECNKTHGGKTIVDWLSEITKVPTNDLLHFQPGLNNIRQRLDWASERQTTRVEDMAYCLLGIFDISMTIAYGEGLRAFHRLQQAIMERSNDRSLFLWTGKPASVSSMLANEAKCFQYDYRQIDADTLETSDASSVDPAFTLTNHGLRIAVSLYSKEQSLNWLKARTSDTRYVMETC